MPMIPLMVDSECERCRGKGSYLVEYYVPTESLIIGGWNHIPKHRVLCSCVKPQNDDSNLSEQD